LLYVLLDRRFKFLLLLWSRHVVAWLGVLAKTTTTGGERTVIPM
jgi:hypothetical protein